MAALSQWALVTASGAESHSGRNGDPDQKPGQGGPRERDDTKPPWSPGVLTAVVCCKAGGGPGLNSRTLTTQNMALADTHACSGATTMAGSGAFYHNLGKKIKKQ